MQNPGFLFCFRWGRPLRHVFLITTIRKIFLRRCASVKNTYLGAVRKKVCGRCFLLIVAGFQIKHFVYKLGI